MVERQIVRVLLAPAKGQQFIYTSPGGGIDFLFRVCLYVGLVASIPVIVYQLLKYLQPLIRHDSAWLIAWGSVASGVLAVVGVLYGYFWGLPAALHFLLHQFVTTQVRPLVTIQSYLSFVTVYMVGSALLFQVPLVLALINRIKPLKPGGLLRYERHVVAGALLIAALMNPTPNIFALLFLAGPIIVSYQAGILIVWYVNRASVRPAAVTALMEQDAAVQTARTQRMTTMRYYQFAAPVKAMDRQAAPALLGRSSKSPPRTL